ncbi:MAG: ABC transporter permease subunit [Alphaproteobacteria bacterium]|uniref:ABC transporter permease subunit n=1 Tax=PS1 clade bacterium TaxID=2175152 RepID=A0A368DN54_9PROT|nr:amino acid ABC transporter permease [Rhodobiaceae bacterium]OUT73610.1 MAG: amino acid ABC transporter permease [Rhizobiales bacterium TMED25]RCL73269.1 MAG: ABC transporter permease subunit [PS1 clade bacterium]|tara:strand:+ start:13166 stop:14005 length:840 start_codon:yes stop_codon:yes gene_type:complete
MYCETTFNDYMFRSLGIGERLLPKTDITLCDQIILIGSGIIWNLYYCLIALSLGFIFSILIAIVRNNNYRIFSKITNIYVFIFRGSPLFIQFFCAYEIFVLLPKIGIDINLLFTTITIQTSWLTKAWLGALIVLFLNTTAYSSEIFYGALKSIPKHDIEAADAFGLSNYRKYKKIILPTMLRNAWSSYTNEAIFLFHATTLVFFSSFPAWGQSGDALYYANYFADKTFNPFIPYPIIAGYFIFITLVLIIIFNLINIRFNRHQPKDRKKSIKFLSNMIR